MAEKSNSTFSLNEFLKMVPTETSLFIRQLLNLVDYFNEELIMDNGVYKKKSNKMIIIILSVLSETEKYKSLLGQNNFKFNFARLISRTTKGINFEKRFAENYNFFGFYNDSTLYANMTPIDILMRAKDLDDDGGYSDILCTMFADASPNKITENFRTFNRKLKTERAHDEARKAYGNLPISVINYLDVANRIRSLLISNTIIADEHITPLSLLLALGYESKDESKELKSIRNYLIKMGMNFKKAYAINGLNTSLTSLEIDIYHEIKNFGSNAFAIRPYYKRYFSEGYNATIPESEVTISGIISNLINREFTNSTIVEKIISRSGINIKDLENIGIKIAEQEQYDKRVAYQNMINKFYELLGKDEREFMQFVTKTYMLILKKMKEGKHNQDVLLSENDADTLSLLLASYYYNLDISIFFKDNGIDIEDILSFLKLEITKEEILSMELDVELMIDKFERFVTKGVNTDTSKITMNTIAYNLCNREFNSSMIVENIFNSLYKSDSMGQEYLTYILEKDGKLGENFLDSLKSYIKYKTQKEKTNLERIFFAQFSPEMRKYIQTLNSYSNVKYFGVTEDVARMYSILLSLFEYDQNIVLLRELGFERNKILKILDKDDQMSSELNIPFLTECLNQVKGSEEISNLNQRDVIFGLFSNLTEEQMSAIEHYVESFPDLPECLKKLSKTKFADFEQTFEKCVHNSEIRKKINFVFGIYSTYPYIVLAIDKALGKRDNETTADVIEKSLVLSLFKSDSNIRLCLENRGITKERVLKYLGLEDDFLEQLDYQNYDLDMFEKYKDYLKSSDVDDIARNLFDDTMGKKSNFLEQMSQEFGIDYKIIEVEALTGQPYEKSLTIADRTKILKDSPVGEINFDDASSILNFGEVLATHSRYIYDEVPLLTAADSGQKSVETITGIIKRSHLDTKNRNILSRIFRKDSAVPVLSKEIINELHDAIDENLKTLFDETLKFDAIRKYMEEYMNKNAEFLKIAEKTRDVILEALSKLDSNNDEDYSKIVSLKSRLKVIEAKINRFRATNLLMKQEIMKINQAIVSHFITINALEMARDDLFPLIGSELALIGGRNSEASSMTLTKGVIDLFQSLLERNVTGVNSNMDAIKRLNVPKELMQALNKDVQTFIGNLEDSQDKKSDKRIDLHL